MKFLVITLLCLLTLLTANNIFARTTPLDIVNSQRSDYEAKVKYYLPEDKQKLENISGQIAVINRKRTDQLDQIMLTQGKLLDEYLRRHDFKSTESTDRARYYITFAHEAVAFQAAKIYIYDLTSESHLSQDALSLINKFQSELEYAKNAVVHSQQVLTGVLR